MSGPIPSALLKLPLWCGMGFQGSSPLVGNFLVSLKILGQASCPLPPTGTLFLGHTNIQPHPIPVYLPQGGVGQMEASLTSHRNLCLLELCAR